MIHDNYTMDGSSCRAPAVLQKGKGVRIVLYTTEKLCREQMYVIA